MSSEMTTPAPGPSWIRGWPAQCPGVPLHRQGAPEDPFKPLRRKHLRDLPLERRSLCTPSVETRARREPARTGRAIPCTMRPATGCQLPSATADDVPVTCPIGWSTPGTHGHSRIATHRPSANRQADLLREPTFLAAAQQKPDAWHAVVKDSASSAGRHRRRASAKLTHSNLSCSCPSIATLTPQGTSRAYTAQSTSSTRTGCGDACKPISSCSSRTAHAVTSSLGLREPVGGVHAQSPSRAGPP